MEHHTANADDPPGPARRLTEKQQETVAANLGLAFAVAKRVAGGRLRYHDYLDLRSEALLGLCRAALTFDPDRVTDRYGEPREVKFCTYAYHGARNQLHTHAASLDTNKRRADAAVERHPTAILARTVAAPEPDEEDADRRAMIAGLHAAIDSLGDRHRAIIRARLAGDTLKAIGGQLGICKERVRQLEARAHTLLRESLAGRYP